MNLDELYFKDNFTKEGEKVNLDVNKLTVDCITSKNNMFSIDNLGNLNVQSVKSIQPIIDMIYPVGSIYISITGTNPSNYFGGSWERIKDRFLLASGDTYSNGSTGGASEHYHKLPFFDYISSGTEGIGCLDTNFFNKNMDFSHPLDSGNWIFNKSSILNGNSDKVHGQFGTTSNNNMPPYLAVYVWKRIG